MDNLKFKVKNLGSVKNGEFEHKPLTIFCGPNNSGKTWAMYSLYHFYTLTNDGIIQFKNAEALLDKEISEFNLVDWLYDSDKEIQQYNKIVSNRLPDFFNCSREVLEGASFAVSMTVEELIKRITKKTLKISRPKISITKAKNSTKVKIIDEGADNDIKKDVMNEFLSVGLFGFSDTFLMPAERHDLHLFYKELSNRRTAILHHASKENINIRELLHDVTRSSYTKPIANYIDWLNDLAEYQKKAKGEFHPFAEKLKKDLAGGGYKVDNRAVNISFKPYQKKRDEKSAKAMGLHMTSSIVKSLFGLWFYLEYQAKQGDTLMIDEPELNIHPENQRKLTRLLAQLVNAGLKVMISTHSDYMIREFNSLIMLGSADEKLLKKHKYNKNEALAAKNVGAYLFDEQAIKPFKITPDDGIYATTFDQVTNDINKVNDDIYYSLKEADNE